MKKKIDEKLIRDIGTRLRQLREYLGYSRHQMASIMGVDYGTYAKNETGWFSPNLNSLNILAFNPGVSLDWLLVGRGSMLAGKSIPGKRPPAVSEVHQLLEHMEAIPLLRHEMMAFYERFLLKNRDLVESSLNPTPSPPAET